MLKKPQVRRRLTVRSQQTWTSTKKSNNAEKFATKGSVDGFSVRAGEKV